MSLGHSASEQQPAGRTPALTVSLITVIAAGLTSATIAAITSVFGWPGTLLGAGFSAMVMSTTSEIYKGYLNSIARRVVLLAGRPAPPPVDPLADRPPPPPWDPTSRARRLPRRIRVSAALRWFSFRISPEMRRSLLSRGLQVGVVATIIGLGIVTAVELDLGGNLPCAIWNTDCSPEGINPPSILAPFYTICQG
jgi:hypothetical protein